MVLEQLFSTNILFISVCQEKFYLFLGNYILIPPYLEFVYLRLEASPLLNQRQKPNNLASVDIDFYIYNKSCFYGIQGLSMGIN